MRPNTHPPRSLLSSERSASSSRSSSSSSHAPTNQKSRSRMKCIISLGLILPALAAVIGVVAWAVSAEAVWGPPGKHGGKLQGSYDINHGHGGYEIPVLQERSDLGFNPKSVLTVQADEDGQTRVISRDDPGIGADNSLPSDLSSDSNDSPAHPPAENPSADSKNDPLYYVHFVPTKDSPVASSTPSSTSVSDLLSKIMSSSGGGKKGAPQFVVFAPMPDGLGGAAGKDVAKQSRKKIKYDDEEDEEEEERRVVRKRKKSRKPNAPVHDYVHASESGRTLGPQRTGDPSYANQQGGSQQYYPPQPAQQPQQPQRNYGSGSTQSYGYADNQQQQQQPQPPPYSSSGSEAQASGDSDRLGLISGGFGGPHIGHGHGKGLSVSIGGGHGALPLSPLGLLKHLFVPILPKPRVNLNGKVVFGVVLEKGVGFGGGKPAVIYRK